MAIDLSASNPIIRPSDRLALVRAILGAHPSDECEWVEWKVDLELDRAQGRFTAAKHVLGFANRSPQDAARFHGGQAFLLIGVEPNNLCGTRRRDPAQLEDWLRSYLGQEGPVWDAHHVEVDGNEVLVIEVAAPKEGDPIHTLRKAFNDWNEGAIFVRHKGKTERATSHDIDQLTRRASAQEAENKLSLLVSWAETDPIVPMLEIDEDSLGNFLEDERLRLLGPLEGNPGEKGFGGKGLGSLVMSSQRLYSAAGWRPENRDPDAYRSQVEGYLEELAEAIPVVALTRAIQETTPIRVRITNPSDANYQKVRLTISVSGSVAAFDPEDVTQEELPAPPRLWGTMRSPRSLLTYNPAHISALPLPSVQSWRTGPKISNESSAHLEFPSLDLRPRAVEQLDPFVLIARPEAAGSRLESDWEATSISVEGVASGSIPILIASGSLDLRELLKEPEDNNDV